MSKFTRKKPGLTVNDIGAQFSELKDKNLGWSDFIIFSHIIRGTDVSSAVLTKSFDILVDKGDYLKGEKRDIVARLKEIAQSVPIETEVFDAGV